MVRSDIPRRSEPAPVEARSAKLTLIRSRRIIEVSMQVPVATAELLAGRATNRDAQVMVALMVPAAVADRLALNDLPGGLAPSELHITLVHLGEVDGLTATERTALNRVAAGVARRRPTLVGEVAGFGRFTDSHRTAGPNVLWAAVDIPYLEDLEVDLVDRLAGIGMPVTREHGFLPHITLAYLPPGIPTPDLALDRLPLRFDALYVAVGAERVRHPFGIEMPRGEESDG
jgi:2'-5' RNA ligase